MMESQEHNGVNGFHESNRNVVIHLSPKKIPLSTPPDSAPPSLSPSSSCRPGINEGDDVMLKDKNDGLVYLGIAVEIDESSGMCLVRFGDGDERWGRLGKEVKSLECADEFDQEEEEESLEGTPNGNQDDYVTSSFVSDSKLNKGLLKRVKESQPKRRSSSNSSRTVPKDTPAHVLSARKELPYDFDSLLWDENHQRNDKERYCYCGESGDWYKKMIQCHKCLQWFHLECIRSTVVPRTILLGDKFYEFVCTLCTGTCEEEVTRLDLNWADALHLTLFNLTVVNNKKYHDLDTSILPFLKRRLKSLQGPGCFLKMSRLDSEFVTSLLSSHTSRFRCGSESKKRLNYWGLCQVAPPLVSSGNNMYSGTPIRAKDTHNNGRIVGGVLSSSSYSIKQQRRPAMKSTSELNIQEHTSTTHDLHTPMLIKPLKPLVLKLNTPSSNDHVNGSKNSYKNSLLRIKEPYPYGPQGRKNNLGNGLKSHRMEPSNTVSFLDPVPVALPSENSLDMRSRGLLAEYELNNGWRNFKAIMRRQTSREALNKNNKFRTLDSFIPPPKDFAGYNNPFRSFNQDPPILFPQTSITSYDLFPNYSSRNGYSECNRRQKRSFHRNRHSVLSSRKNSLNSSGDATPERDMDWSSSCSNSVDENVTGGGLLNPPPLLDFNEPLHLAPPSPQSVTSKSVDLSSQNDKSPPDLDLFPPPAAAPAISSFPSESDTIPSHNNNKPTHVYSTKIPHMCSNSNSKSIKHKSTTLGDLKCPTFIKSILPDNTVKKYLTNGTNVSHENKTLKSCVNARRLTLDGDIHYLFDLKDRGGSCNHDFKAEDFGMDVTQKSLDSCASSKIKQEQPPLQTTDTPEDKSVDTVQVHKEEKVVEEIKNEPNINCNSSLSAIAELPVNNTATSSSDLIICLT